MVRAEGEAPVRLATVGPGAGRQAPAMLRARLPPPGEGQAKESARHAVHVVRAES